MRDTAISYPIDIHGKVTPDQLDVFGFGIYSAEGYKSSRSRGAPKPKELI